MHGKHQLIFSIRITLSHSCKNSKQLWMPKDCPWLWPCRLPFKSLMRRMTCLLLTRLWTEFMSWLTISMASGKASLITILHCTLILWTRQAMPPWMWWVLFNWIVMKWFKCLFPAKVKLLFLYFIDKINLPNLLSYLIYHRKRHLEPIILRN